MVDFISGFLEGLLGLKRGGGSIILFIILLIVAYIGLCMISASMAEKRGRSQVGWFLLSFFSLFPILGMILLAFLGETNDKRRDRIMEEEQWRRMIRD